MQFIQSAALHLGVLEVALTSSWERDRDRQYPQSCGSSNYSEISGMFGCARLFLAPISRKLCITANRVGVHYRNQSNVRLIRYINENSAIALEHTEYVKSGLRKNCLFRRQWGVAPGQHWALVVPLLVKRPEAVEAWQKTPMYLAFGAVDKCVQMCSTLYLLWVNSGQCLYSCTSCRLFVGAIGWVIW